MLNGEKQRNGTTKAMADEMPALDGKGIHRCDDGSCEIGDAAALQDQSRVAMTGQIDGMSWSVDRQLRLIEHPAVEITAEAVDQDEWRRVLRIQGENIDRIVACIDHAGQRTLDRLLGSGSSGHTLAGDEAIDLAVGYIGLGDDAEKRAHRNRYALLDKLPPDDARRRRLHDIGDLAGLDFEQIAAGLDCLAVCGQPADELALGHRHAPSRHGNGMDTLAHRQPSMVFLTDSSTRSELGMNAASSVG